MEKIVRTVCLFSSNIDPIFIEKKQKIIQEKLLAAGFVIQTQRACFSNASILDVETAFGEQAGDYILSIGSLDRTAANAQIDNFIQSPFPIAFNLQLEDAVRAEDVALLFKIMRQAASKTFHFTYSFCNATSSPFFPAANFAKEGFSIGLQPTNLAAGCTSLAAWFANMRQVWLELMDLFGGDASFLGIDASIAPLFGGESSFIHFIQQFSDDFAETCTSDIFTQVSNFIKNQNPKSVGLSGLMFPCLEDFELAKLYEQGDFSIERNLFLSLHSGLGIDTYPIGMDESPERVLQILQLLFALSQKYQKPLAARFVADGKAKIGAMTNFENQYLKDIVVRKL